MGFFGRILGQRQAKDGRSAPVRQTREMALGEASRYVEEHLSKSRAETEMKLHSRFAEIKHLLLDLKAIVKELQQRDLEAEEGSKRLRKIAQTSKQQLVSKIASLSDKLMPPQATGFDALAEYCARSKELMGREILMFRKNIAITGILMKGQVKSMGSCFQELSAIFSELEKTLGQSNAAKLADALRLISEINGMDKEESAEKESVSALEKELLRMRSGKKSAARRLEALSKSEDAKELAGLEESRKSLESKRESVRRKAAELFSGVEKPLRKLLNMSLAKKYALGKEREAIVRKYLESPVAAAKHDPNGKAIKEALSELRSAIESKALPLKEKDIAKRVAAIDSLLSFDFFSEIFWELNKIEVESKAAEKKINALSISEEISSQRRELSLLEAGEAETLQAIKSAEQKISKLSASVNGSVQLLEKSLGEASLPVKIKI